MRDWYRMIKTVKYYHFNLTQIKHIKSNKICIIICVTLIFICCYLSFSDQEVIQSNTESGYYAFDKQIVSTNIKTFGSFVSIPYFYIKQGHLNDGKALLSLGTFCDLNIFSDARQFAINYKSGPISIGVYIDADYRHSTASAIELKSLFSQYLNDIPNPYDIMIGLLYINTSSPMWQKRQFLPSTPLMLKFPTNALRNLVEYQIQDTQYLMTIDIDFYHLSATFNQININNQQILNTFNTYPKETIFIIPAFEILSINNQNHIKYNELSKSELLTMVNNNEIAPFHASMMAQKCTDYNEWYQTTTNYELQYQNNNNCSWAYEPWYIIQTNLSKKAEYQWDNDYIGRGLNKVQRTFKLRHHCFQFTVMKDLFMIHTAKLHHTEHFTQKDKENWHAFNKQMVDKQKKEYYNYPGSCSYPYESDTQCESGILSGPSCQYKQWWIYRRMTRLSIVKMIYNGKECGVCCPSHCEYCKFENLQYCVDTNQPECCPESILDNDLYCTHHTPPCIY